MSSLLACGGRGGGEEGGRGEQHICYDPVY
jgi:hypothetical protein